MENTKSWFKNVLENEIKTLDLLSFTTVPSLTTQQKSKFRCIRVELIVGSSLDIQPYIETTHRMLSKVSDKKKKVAIKLENSCFESHFGILESIYIQLSKKRCEKTSVVSQLNKQLSLEKEYTFLIDALHYQTMHQISTIVEIYSKYNFKLNFVLFTKQSIYLNRAAASLYSLEEQHKASVHISKLPLDTTIIEKFLYYNLSENTVYLTNKEMLFFMNNLEHSNINMMAFIMFVRAATHREEIEQDNTYQDLILEFTHLYFDKASEEAELEIGSFLKVYTLLANMECMEDKNKPNSNSKIEFECQEFIKYLSAEDYVKEVIHILESKKVLPKGKTKVFKDKLRASSEDGAAEHRSDTESDRYEYRSKHTKRFKLGNVSFKKEAVDNNVENFKRTELLKEILNEVLICTEIDEEFDTHGLTSSIFPSFEEEVVRDAVRIFPSIGNVLQRIQDESVSYTGISAGLKTAIDLLRSTGVLELDKNNYIQFS
eukprot:GAHX01002859.1.p1 GENE.GAHX01002859.1~~GAHX01002859.1.p1  ORF type:complete len:487 (-),score=89.50 GAHX01002859.1:219-1679(-)